MLSYEAILGQLGQNLVLANSGQEALQKLMKDDFAVVLLDVSMPEMDGFETASLIHDHPRFEKTPIIFVTGVNITEFDRLKGYRLGAVDYVYVPVVPEILRSKVAALVELHCKRLELQQLNQSLERANQRLALAHSTLQAEKNRELEAVEPHAAERQRAARGDEPRFSERSGGAPSRRSRADRGGPSQERIHRDPRARAAQSARADQQRRADRAQS